MALRHTHLASPGLCEAFLPEAPALVGTKPTGWEKLRHLLSAFGLTMTSGASDLPVQPVPTTHATADDDASGPDDLEEANWRRMGHFGFLMGG